MAVRTVGAKTAPALNQIGTPANPTGSFADLETAIRTLGAAVATVATRNVSGTFDGMSAARLGPSPVSAAASINVDSVAHTIELQVFPAGHVFDASADLGSDTDDNAIYCAYFAGDVTILPGVTVTTKRRKRGMAWVVNGTLNNYGTLTMTARGAYNVAGAALLLRAGATVPAAGSAGGVGVVSDNNGTTGTAGASRGTGGGGAGASRSGGTSGAGSAGTGNRSGAGGAGSHVAGANDGSATGFGGLVDGNTSAGAYGGAGVWPGISQDNGMHGFAATDWAKVFDGSSVGCAGLLVVIAANIINQTGALISSDGSPGVPVPNFNVPGGGGTGGGSVNLFYDIAHTNNGTERASGGLGGCQGAAAGKVGGNGGAGTVTATNF